MKVAFFSTHVLWPRIFETQLELMQDVMNATGSSDKEVHHIVCDRDISYCDVLSGELASVPIRFFASRKAARCKACVRTREEGTRLLSGVQLIEHRLQPRSTNDAPDLLKYSTIEELRNLTYENFNVGEATLSNIISALRTSEPDLEEIRPAADRLIVSSVSLYCQVIKLLQDNRFDKVFVFNGRFAHTRAILCACRAAHVTFCTFEVGCDAWHYALYENSTPHNLIAFEELVDQTWNAEPDVEKKTKIAREFYENRVSGVEQGWFSFVNRQAPGLLPKAWDPGKRNVVIFNSSEDEFAAAGPEWRGRVYKNQIDGIKRIAESFKELAGEQWKLHLRIHPNLAYADKLFVTHLLSLQSEWLNVVAPDSKVCSYAMLFACEKAVTFGSTVGIEAAYWNKPSILAGVAAYRKHNVSYVPGTHGEVMELLLGDIPPMARQNTFPYGYFCSIYGKRHKYYEPDSIQRGRFKTVSLDRWRRPGYITLARKMSSLLVRVPVVGIPVKRMIDIHKRKGRFI